MSVTACRGCDQQITFIQAANGRWRPVEVTFEELVLAGQEIATEMVGGIWTETGVEMVRIYSAHICPENPAWNRGRPRTRQGNEATGEVTDEVTDEAPEPTRDVGPTMSGRELRDMRDREVWLLNYAVEAQYPCRECDAEAGQPCKSSYGGVATGVHRPRKIASYFTEDDDSQPWPPRRHNQKGMKIMRDWLQQNAGVLTGEEVSP